MNNAALDIALIFGSTSEQPTTQRRDRKVFRRDLRSGLDYREIRLSDRGSNRREERHHESNVIDNQTFDVLSTSLRLFPSLTPRHCLAVPLHCGRTILRSFFRDVVRINGQLRNY